MSDLNKMREVLIDDRYYRAIIISHDEDAAVNVLACFRDNGGEWRMVRNPDKLKRIYKKITNRAYDIILCPDCGSEIIHGEACATCRVCGYSQCG